MYENYSSQQQLDMQTGLNTYISKVFGKMFIGLLVTAIVAFLTATSETMIRYVVATPVMFVAIIAELIVVIVLSSRIQKLSYQTATLLFYVYAILNGISLSSIFLVYNLGMIAISFFTTAVIFGVMSIYGMVTKKDLTKFGSLALMFLIGIIVATIINMFLQSSTLNLVISFVAVAIFTGLVAFDTQKLKSYYYQTIGNNEMQMKIGILGALSLYLDFINIFLYILRIFNNKK